MLLIKTLVDVVTLPVSVVADVVTLGGSVNDRDTTYTGDHLRTIALDGVKIYDKISK